MPQADHSPPSETEALSQVIAQLEEARRELKVTKSALERREVELHEQREQTKKLADQMQRLLSKLSHDLRSPLVTIQGFSGLISMALDQNDVEDARDSAARIARATKKLADLVQGVLKMGRGAGAPEHKDSVEVDSPLGDEEVGE